MVTSYKVNHLSEKVKYSCIVFTIVDLFYQARSHYSLELGVVKEDFPIFHISVWPTPSFNLYPVQSFPTTSYVTAWQLIRPVPPHTLLILTWWTKWSATSLPFYFYPTPHILLLLSPLPLLSLPSSEKIYKTADAAKQAAQWLCCTPVHTLHSTGVQQVSTRLSRL